MTSIPYLSTYQHCNVHKCGSACYVSFSFIVTISNAELNTRDWKIVPEIEKLFGMQRAGKLSPLRTENHLCSTSCVQVKNIFMIDAKIKEVATGVCTNAFNRLEFIYGFSDELPEIVRLHDDEAEL